MKEKEELIFKYQEFKEEMDKKEKEIFEKTFKDKPFDVAVYNGFRIPLIGLSRVQCQFIILINILTKLKNDKNYYDGLSIKEKRQMSKIIESVSLITDEIDIILSPITSVIRT